METKRGGVPCAKLHAPMAAGELIHALLAASREFGPRAAHAKATLLQDIAGADQIAPRDLVTLQEVCNFLRAYPDNGRVLRAAMVRVKG